MFFRQPYGKGEVEAAGLTRGKEEEEEEANFIGIVEYASPFPSPLSLHHQRTLPRGKVEKPPSACVLPNIRGKGKERGRAGESLEEEKRGRQKRKVFPLCPRGKKDI